MPDINAPYHPKMRSDEIKAQIQKLEALDHRTPVNPSFEAFDLETQELLGKMAGEGSKYVESYQYATMGESEAIVNLPESAQEPLARDLPKTGLQQRRQVLQSVLSEIEELEAEEAQVLNGEDREDPPGMS
ncbi:MAG TPA: hypothetical protein VFQ34_05770 [Nitrospiraceae bacterium]|jgi:hypothetical protein|nr:hypothetical protein [Nitrospiraceae bacterium]